MTRPKNDSLPKQRSTTMSQSDTRDVHVNETALDIGKSAGNGGFEYSVPPKAVIVVVFVVAALLLPIVFVFGVRALLKRRKVDLINRAREQGLSPIDGQPGDPIRLADLDAVGSHASEQGTWGVADVNGMCAVEQRSLFYYVLWRDPYRTKIVKPETKLKSRSCALCSFLPTRPVFQMTCRFRIDALTEECRVDQLSFADVHTDVEPNPYLDS